MIQVARGVMLPHGGRNQWSCQWMEEPAKGGEEDEVTSPPKLQTSHHRGSFFDVSVVHRS